MMLKDQTSEKLAYINALRGIAVILVVMVHSLEGDKRVFLSSLWGMGAKGVQLFFIASAFTLFFSNSKRSRLERFPIRNFFIRRIFRIVPLFYIAIAYYSLINIYVEGEYVSAVNIASHLSFLNGLYPYYTNTIVPGGWSIAVEMMFYAVCPLLFKKISTKKSAIAAYCMAIVFGEILSQILLRHRFISDSNVWVDYLYWTLWVQLPTFLIGAILFYDIKSTAFEKIKSGLLILLSIFGLYLLQFLLRGYLSGTCKSFLLGNATIGLVFYMLFNAASLLKYSILPARILCWIGTISFSIYLSHFTIINLLDAAFGREFVTNATANYAFRFLSVLFISSVVSSITYKYIEEPARKLGSQLIKYLEAL